MKEKASSLKLLLCLLSLFTGLSKSLELVEQKAEQEFIETGVKVKSVRARNLKDSANSFKALLQSSPDEQSPTPFFDFPEAKLVQQQSSQDKTNGADFLEKNNEDGSASLKDGPKAKSRRLKWVSAKYADLLPDLDQLLQSLKPKTRKAMRKLKVVEGSEVFGESGASGEKKQSAKKSMSESGSCSEEERLAGKCRKLTLVDAPSKGDKNKMKNFQTFTNEFLKTQRVSNRKLWAMYHRALSEEAQEEEKDYQAFLLFASDQYSKLQAQIWESEQDNYQKVLASNKRKMAAQIMQKVEQTAKKLMEDFDSETATQTLAYQKDYTAELWAMQAAHNAAYLRDYEMVNKLENKQESQHPTINEWKAQDQVFIDSVGVGVQN